MKYFSHFKFKLNITEQELLKIFKKHTKALPNNVFIENERIETKLEYPTKNKKSAKTEIIEYLTMQNQNSNQNEILLEIENKNWTDFKIDPESGIISLTKLKI